jgi:homoserine dehydrogenase
MTPCLVPADSPLGQLQGGTNMVVLEGDAVGQIVLRGAGAGEGPTASAVMADVIDLARGIRVPTFGVPAVALAEPVAARAATPAPYYLRMTLLDKPGALAKIATCIGEAGISIDRMRQLNQPGEADDTAVVLIVTHKAAPADVAYALSRFGTTGVMRGAPVAIRIEEV